VTCSRFWVLEDIEDTEAGWVVDELNGLDVVGLLELFIPLLLWDMRVPLWVY